MAMFTMDLLLPVTNSETILEDVVLLTPCLVFSIV